MMAAMWYLTKEESQAWCQGHALRLDEAAHPIINDRAHSVTTSLSGVNWSRLTWLSEFLASYLEPFDECLLWVTLWVYGVPARIFICITACVKAMETVGNWRLRLAICSPSMKAVTWPRSSNLLLFSDGTSTF